LFQKWGTHGLFILQKYLLELQGRSQGETQGLGFLDGFRDSGGGGEG